ncbi:multicopper oxidase [Ilyonectria sp. MPI-CAGE-AT-0026]|nr:multicopper oxidase [Ilyonectria sp. MPI-CAGE-AT-0026]
MFFFQPLLLLYLLPLRSLALAREYDKVYDLTLTWEKHAPDGFERDMILINGQFPGPLLEMDEGDYVEVKVHNQMPFNTTVHFHGIEMLHTPWSDGVPGVTQISIIPGSNFSHKWTATQHGSYWYHAHVGGQIDDGLYGPIIIHPRRGREKPFGLISQDPAAVAAMEYAERRTQPVVLSDHRHVPSVEVWDIATKANMELTCYDSILVNGRGSSRCRSPQEIEELVTPEQRAIMNSGNITMTDKGCIPPEFMSRGVGHPNVIPHGIYRGCQNSDGGETVLTFKQSRCQAQSWIALEFVGAFGLLNSMVSIDGLAMWVYAVDGDYVVPQKVEAIPVNNGDRFSVLIKADRAGNYTLRVASNAAVQILSGYATLSIRQRGGHSGRTNDTSIPTQYIRDNGMPTSPEVAIFNETLAKPYPAEPIPDEADVLYKLEMQTAGSSLYWAVDDVPLHLGEFEHLEPPILLDQEAVHALRNTTIITRSGQWVDLVFVSKVFPMPSHPMHKHGNKMRLLGTGTGEWTWPSVKEAAAAMPGAFNLVNPPRKDTFSSPRASTEPAWMAVRYYVENPGPWLLHCHILTHSEGGMSMLIMDGVDNWPEVPDYYLRYNGMVGGNDECIGED